MTFDDWWGAYPTQEDYEANCRDAWDASAASRDREIAELKVVSDHNLHIYQEAASKMRAKIATLRDQATVLRDAIEYSGVAKTCQELADALATAKRLGVE